MARPSACRGDLRTESRRAPQAADHPRRTRRGGFRITGQKAWVSNGPSAEAIIVFAITSEEAGRKRYSAFIVPHDTTGLTISEMPGFHALRPSRHCLLTLDNCLVPDNRHAWRPGSAYDRMALPFRDIEDAVGTFGTLGALRHAIGLFAGTETQQPEELGAIVALTSVFAAGASSVVAALDTGRFPNGRRNPGRTARPCDRYPGPPPPDRPAASR